MTFYIKSFLPFILIFSFLTGCENKNEIEVLTHPDSRLREILQPVMNFDEHLKNNFSMMLNYAKKANAVGLAGNQIGIKNRIVVAYLDRQWLKMVNPVIVESKGEQHQIEGCLSIPGINVVIKRPYQVKVEYQNLNGKKLSKTFIGLDSAIVSHEIDHLNGILIIDHAEHVFSI